MSWMTENLLRQLRRECHDKWNDGSSCVLSGSLSGQILAHSTAFKLTSSWLSAWRKNWKTSSGLRERNQHTCTSASLAMGRTLSGCRSERPGSETAAPERRKAHTGGRPLRATSCGPGSQSWGCWTARGRWAPCPSSSPLPAPSVAARLRGPRCNPPSGSHLASGCRSLSWPHSGSPIGFLVFDPDCPRWCRSGKKAVTWTTEGERRRCRFPPGG